MRKGAISNLRHQRGAIGVWGAMTLMLAVIFTALAVDSGRLWMQRRQLQLVADIAAIQAAKHMGCGFTLTDVVTAAQQAAANNGYKGSLAASPNKVELGNVTTVGGIRQFSAGAGQEAVHVYATQTVPASLVAGGMFTNQITLHAEAVASANPPIAAFSAGSFLARLTTNDDASLLNGLMGNLLGSSLNLDLVSYQGIAASDVTLLGLLKAQNQVGTVDELLASNMSLADFAQLTATAMSNSGTANAQAVAAMQQLATATVSNLSLNVGDVLAVTSPDKQAAGNVNVNALSLIMTAAMVANGQHALTLPLAVSVPPITSVSALVTVIEPPQLAIGPSGNNGVMCTTLHTAQIRAQAGVKVNLALAAIDLALKLEVAQGSAGLESITDNGGDTEVQIAATPGIASLALTGSNGTGTAQITTLLGIPIANLGLNLPIQSSAQTLVYDVPHPVADNLPQTQTVSSPVGGSLENALSQSNALSVTVLGIGVGGLVNSVVNSVVSPLLGQIGKVLLDPLLDMLGLHLGGMDVTLDGVQWRQSKPLII